METNQRTTVVGVFDRRDQAERAVTALEAAGFRDDQIGLAMRGEAGGNVAGRSAEESTEHAGGGAATGAVLGGVLGAIAAGKLLVRVGARFPLAEAAAAHRALEGRATTGKVVLLP
jgi:NADPH:quinone reductase-like Zn-dependent oxidoreductase